MTHASVPPPVPPGPGAEPPIPAAPSEGGGTRLGWALGIAGGLVALCCGGGLVAGVGLAVTGVQAINERAHVTVGTYLDALKAKKYEQAYELLCEDEQQRLDLARFTSREQARPERIQSYELGEVELEGTSGITLPVTERYTDGDSEQVVYRLAQDPKTTDLEVCGRE
ncbi:hypothetical protein [Catellatospora methionotrophica]|uniref:hypothetical protein n=1 Tax=Catellatospora methionotrophica TaxID=121620 RepID=UPI0033D60C5A